MASAPTLPSLIPMGPGSEMKIRVALADDHRPVRAAIRELLRSEPDIDVVGEAGTRAGALALADRVSPDLFLLDLQLPDGSGITAIPELLHRRPGIRVIVLTMFEEPRLRSEAIEAGASRYLLKDSPPQELLDAVRAESQESGGRESQQSDRRSSRSGS